MQIHSTFYQLELIYANYSLIMNIKLRIQHTVVDLLIATNNRSTYHLELIYANSLYILSIRAYICKL